MMCFLALAGCESPTVYVGRRPDEDPPSMPEDDDTEPQVGVDAGALAPSPEPEPDDEPTLPVATPRDAGASDPTIIFDPDAGTIELSDGGDWNSQRPRFVVRRCQSGRDCRSFFSWLTFCELTYFVCVPCFDGRCYDRKLTAH